MDVRVEALHGPVLFVRVGRYLLDSTVLSNKI